MSPLLICILIIVIEALIIALLIFILVMVIKNKRQKSITEYNDRLLKAEELKRVLREKGNDYDKKINAAKNSDDLVNIYNDILSNYGNKN